MTRGAVGVATTVVVLLAACTASPVDVSTPTPTASPTATAVTTSTATATDTPSPTPTTPTATPTPEPVVGPIDADRALAVAVALADGVGRRVPGTDGDLAARALVTAELESAGWVVTSDPVPLPQGGETANLIATVDGGVPEDGPVVVVGSHLDTLGGVGANDNASGVGVLVAVAAELRDEVARLPLPVVLVAFGAEERQDAPGRPNHLGSEQLAARLADRTVAMLSVDMIGNGPTTRIMGLEGTDDALVRRIAAVAGRDGVTDVETGARGNVSDHGAFALRGVPAAFLWTGPDDRLHTAADTTEHLDVADLARAGALTLAFLRDLGPDDVDGLEAPDG